MQGAETAELKSVRNKAVDAVVDFIRFPDQYQFDLLEADAVMQLREDPEFSVLYQLLSTLLKSDNIKVGLHYSFLAIIYTKRLMLSVASMTSWSGRPLGCSASATLLQLQ